MGGSTATYYWAGLGLVVAALALCSALAVGDRRSVLRQAFQRRAATLEQALRFVRAPLSGGTLAALQATAVAAGLVGAVLSGDPLLLVLVPIAAVGPDLWLQ